MKRTRLTYTANRLTFSARKKCYEYILINDIFSICTSVLSKVKCFLIFRKVQNAIICRHGVI